MDSIFYNPDDPYNFLAFSVDQFNNVLPYLNEYYLASLDFFNLNYFKIKFIFIVLIICILVYIAYLAQKTSKVMKDHRKFHIFEYIGLQNNDGN